MLNFSPLLLLQGTFGELPGLQEPGLVAVWCRQCMRMTPFPMHRFGCGLRRWFQQGPCGCRAQHWEVCMTLAKQRELPVFGARVVQLCYTPPRPGLCWRSLLLTPFSQEMSPLRATFVSLVLLGSGLLGNVCQSHLCPSNLLSLLQLK